ncbi:MAG: hypothetical protein M1608_12515 [Candidatus Omnitrophica bacterium]|nr:hypothetical protein [Candidatus Omnitrophota bacterium]
MAGQLTTAHKQALKLFRERHGGIPDSLKQYAANFRRERKLLSEALCKGAATVPELARETGLPSDRVLWHIAGMRKYGLAREAGQEGDYVKFELMKE